MLEDEEFARQVGERAGSPTESWKCVDSSRSTATVYGQLRGSSRPQKQSLGAAVLH